MNKIIIGLLCTAFLLMLSGSSRALPISGTDEETENFKNFLKCSNNVMLASSGLEIHYKQLPASKIPAEALKSGTTKKDIRKYLSSFALISFRNPVKIANTTLQAGEYLFGLEESKEGTGKWFFSIYESSSRKYIMRLEPIFDTLTPANTAHVITMEINRRPGSNRFKIEVKLGSLSIATREAFEI
ncbi:MAG: hypothetical protein JNN15_15215 [Blastocatellia bacterium]|nr:hypothetical protein [Blastocatellia bacterium]